VKLIFRNGMVSLAAETDDERAICAQLVGADGHIFRLNCSTERGFSLTSLGEEAEARREPLNILRTVDPRFAPISNLAHAPFELDGRRYASVEAFWQGLKSPDADTRMAMAGLFGVEARRAGDALEQPQTFEYGGQVLRAGSAEHRDLMRRACEAKFDQDEGARQALLATGERWLTHRARGDSRTIPGAVMADIWMRIRRRLLEAGQA
jgi:predicted NAD-dependent protein-ADP-ribosyltransferase YbiA (DUF1768 family)